jgi:hypothetical protein
MESSVYSCDLCSLSFCDYWLYIAHRELVHMNEVSRDLSQESFLLSEPMESTSTATHLCNLCQESFRDEWLLVAHHELMHCVRSSNIIDYDAVENTTQNNGRSEVLCPTSNEPSIQVFAEALEGAVVRHYRVQNVNDRDLAKFLDQTKQIIVNTLRTELERLNCVKFNLLLDCNFSNVENEVSLRGFIARSRSILKTSDLDSVVEECLQELILKLTEHEGRGSGWSLLNIISMDVRVHKQGYGQRGGSFIPLPKKISDTKSCVNVQNADNECFKYAMLTKFLSNDPNSNKPSKKYNNFNHKYNFNGISFPTPLKDIDIFQKNNLGVSVNVFGIDDSKNVYPLRVVSRESRDHTDLLLLKDGDSMHYVFIKCFSRLIAGQLRNKNKHVLTVCKRCLNYSTKGLKQGGSKWLEDHLRVCGQKPFARIVLPTNERRILKFDKVSHQYRIPLVVYADFEASLLPINEEGQDQTNQTRTKYQMHDPNSFCILLKSTLDDDHLETYKLSSKPDIYRGEHASKVFVDRLYDIANKAEKLYNDTKPMKPLDDFQTQYHNCANSCYLCNEAFQENNIKTRDHDHLTGVYRGPACNACNINYKLPKFIPIVIHNLSRYDSHFIVPELGRDKGKIDVLATTNENFISFSKKVGNIKLRFIDSFRFMSSSLLTLSESLEKKDLVETKKLVPPNKIDLVLRKGVFPYDYIDSTNKFNETSLPSKEHFYNKLNETHIEEEDYQHACKVYNDLKMKSLGEYSDFYVKLDVTLLSDVMEEFRNTCFKAYSLDPLHSYTAPGLAWQAMLKETKCKLELLTDVDMLLMIESAVRGGITQSITRHVKANNRYIPGYDSTKESIYLSYFDANNLYGWAMSKPLPYGSFKWVNPDGIGNILQIPINGDVGYFLECDFEYPEYLHDQHYDLPLLARSEIPPGKKHPKLMTTLENKTRYVAHYLVVQQAVELGLRITKIHRALQFDQSCWLQPYINSNTVRRAAARSTFEKEFYKLMNNSVFGKTLQNNRKHKDIKLISDKKKLERLVAKPNFGTSIIINENLVAVCMNKTVIKMDKPLYVGASILDISKTHMYDFHYNKMVPYYGRDRIGITYVDTDAFIYYIKTMDIYEDLKCFTHKDEFDFSDYPKTHLLYDKGVNKKVLGKFKDEANGKVIKEIIALTSKMYAFELLDQNDCNNDTSTYVKKAKGIKKLFLKKKVVFEQYKKCLLENKTYTATYNTIRSFNHKIYSITETKKSLTSNDDKRVILEDGIHTLPYGHYSLRYIAD